MRVSRWMRLMGVAALAALAVVFVSGCDDSSSKSKGGSSSGGGGSSAKAGSVVGTWQIGDGGGSTTWSFNADGSLSSGGISGTFKQNGDHVTGDLTNAGVGSGAIDATLSADGKSMAMDFIEFWHDPAKHNPLSGTKQ